MMRRSRICIAISSDSAAVAPAAHGPPPTDAHGCRRRPRAARKMPPATPDATQLLEMTRRIASRPPIRAAAAAYLATSEDETRLDAAQIKLNDAAKARDERFARVMSCVEQLSRRRSSPASTPSTRRNTGHERRHARLRGLGGSKGVQDRVLLPRQKTTTPPRLIGSYQFAILRQKKRARRRAERGLF